MAAVLLRAVHRPSISHRDITMRMRACICTGTHQLRCWLCHLEGPRGPRSCHLQASEWPLHGHMYAWQLAAPGLHLAFGAREAFGEAFGAPGLHLRTALWEKRRGGTGPQRKERTKRGGGHHAAKGRHRTRTGATAPWTELAHVDSQGAERRICLAPWRCFAAMCTWARWPSQAESCRKARHGGEHSAKVLTHPAVARTPGPQK